MEELQPSSIDSSSSNGSGSSRDTVIEAPEEYLAKTLFDAHQQLSWDKFDKFFKASLQEVDACPSSEKKFKLTKKLVRFWDLLVIVEQGGKCRKS